MLFPWSVTAPQRFNPAASRRGTMLPRAGRGAAV